MKATKISSHTKRRSCSKIGSHTKGEVVLKKISSFSKIISCSKKQDRQTQAERTSTK